MKTKLFFNLIVLCLSSSLSLSAQAYFLQHGFETGNMTPSPNPEGFAWDNNNRTSVVTMEPTCGGYGPGDPVAVWNNKPICNNNSTGVDWTAKNSSYSLRFRYPSGATESWAEQRFSLGSALNEVWVRFWLRVPTNYQSVQNSKPGNSKLLALWMDGYEGAGQGTTSVWEFWRDGSGGAEVKLRYRNEVNNFNSGHQQGRPFITYPGDQGRWMSLVFRVVAETGVNANNGIMQMWRKWEGEGSYSQLHNWSGLDIQKPASPDGFRNGYVMGWSNPGYLVDTDFQIDNFTVSDQSLLTTFSPEPPNPVTID